MSFIIIWRFLSSTSCWQACHCSRSAGWALQFIVLFMRLFLLLNNVPIVCICRLLNGNNLNGSLPEEIGFLPNLNRIQIDQNYISGPIPKSFANLNKTKHLWVESGLHLYCWGISILMDFQCSSSHMNNNSLSGQIPPELSRLPSLVHL